MYQSTFQRYHLLSDRLKDLIGKKLTIIFFQQDKDYPNFKSLIFIEI